MPPTPLQLACDQAVLGQCLADAIEHSGLQHLTGASPIEPPTVLRDLSSVRSAATQAKHQAAAAHARAAELRVIAEAACDGASQRTQRT